MDRQALTEALAEMKSLSTAIRAVSQESLKRVQRIETTLTQKNFISTSQVSSFPDISNG